MTDLTVIQKIAIYILPLIFAVTLHEVAHGLVAYLCGDYTAKMSGRLTLNPLKHVDPVGTILVPMLMLLFSNFIFGWAKPVPVDPRNMHHPRRDLALVAAAGPIANLLMALIWGLIAKLGMMLAQQGNMAVGVPLNGMGDAGIIINVFLAVLNLIPLPPLDGSKILMSALPRKAAWHYSKIEPFGFYILLILMFLGVLTAVMMPAVTFLLNSIGNLYGL